jgi:hypothetical protein
MRRLFIYGHRKEHMVELSRAYHAPCPCVVGLLSAPSRLGEARYGHAPFRAQNRRGQNRRGQRPIQQCT